MRNLVILAAAGLAACSAKPPQSPKPAPAAAATPAVQAPAGEYVMDPAHTSLNFRIGHMGLSHYTARFTKLDGRLQFDPAHPAAQSVVATIGADSVQTNYPDPKALDFDSQVEREFLDAKAHPVITFKSTKVEPTGPNTANVTGDLTFHGVTRPVTLATTFNGGYPPGGMDPMGARVGFSATGVVKRSQFGSTYGLPPPGSNMGVGDDVDVTIEAEFTRK